MYILWDWNGTLLDDTEICRAALNEMLRARHLPEVDLTYFKDHFSFPSRRFYEELGIRVTDPEWHGIAQEFHDLYHKYKTHLNAETVDVLKKCREAGVGQSIISALRQDFLSSETQTFGIADYFDHIYGVDNLDGGTKLDRARGLMALLKEEGKMPPFVLIGDSLHDKEVADALGISCILFGGGSHSLHRLAAVAPAFPTLLDCLSYALGK